MDTYLDLLKQFISAQSVSTDPAYTSGITAAVNWLLDLFKKNDFNVRAIKGFQNPILVAEHQQDPDLETCLIYGHYDVQPANEAEGWTQSPFELLQTKERLVARGAVDNKGQVMVHIASVLELIRTKQLRYNIKFLIEGNEETGSGKIGEFIRANKKLLKADFVMMSDGELLQGKPAIELGFRGGFNTTLTVTTAPGDLHSGVYGGVAPSALHEMIGLLAKMFDDKWLPKYPGFYDDALVPTAAEKAAGETIGFNEAEYKRITGAKTTLNEPGYDFFTQVGLRPSVQITGISSGFAGDGYRNAIPAKAVAKINFRLVKNQDPQKIVEGMEKFIKDNLPSYATYDLLFSDPYHGVKLDIDNEYIKDCAAKLKQAYQVDPIYRFVGGGLPIATDFSEILKIPVVSTPFANEDCNMHAVDENFLISDLQKALKFSTIFFKSASPGNAKS